MSHRIGVTCVLSILAFSLGAAAHAQSGLVRVQPGIAAAVKPSDASITERLNALEMRNAALTAQVTQLQTQLTAYKASNDKQVFGDGFRITALEANQKQGGTTTQLSAQLNMLTQRVSAVEGLKGALDSLSAKFATHTHTFQRTVIGWAPYSDDGHVVASLINKDIMANDKTSPPN